MQLSYAIGVAKPLSIYADLHGTGHIEEGKLEAALKDAMNLSPRGIREHLKLNKPIYARTSAYGHFGRAPDAEGGFSWEKTDLADNCALSPSGRVARRATPERRPRPGAALYGRAKGKTLRAITRAS